MLSLALLSGSALAQGRPQPQNAPRPQVIDSAGLPTTLDDGSALPVTGTRRSGGATNAIRPVMPDIDMDALIPLSMDDVNVEDCFQFLADSTGKIIMPINIAQLGLKKITLRSSTEIPRWKALDMVIEAMRLNGIGIVEQEDILIIGDAAQISAISRMPLIGPDVDISDRIDTGTMIIKVFQVSEVDAEGIGENLADFIPDTATLTVDPNSNKVIVNGDLGLCQLIEDMIKELDRSYIKEQTRVFRLSYADASEIAENIGELFEEDATAGPTRGGPRTINRGGRTAQPNATPGSPGPETQLVQTVNINTNSVTVKADPATIRQIEDLIVNHWDLPRSAGTSKVYVLDHTDSLVMRDTLKTVLGQAGTSGQGPRNAGGGTAGQRSDVTQVISGIYQIEAYPDKNALVVLCKTEESFNFLDQLIESLDQPSTVALPIVIPLKHANAVELTEQLNVLLASSGGGSLTLPRPQSGLSGPQTTTFDSNDSGGGGGGTAGTTDAGQINFPWQGNRGGAGGQELSDPSPLIGKVRIVPIVRQNALAILAPPAEREGVRDLIHYFDRPGRQVMISAIIAEVELSDDFALGIRVSSGGISPANNDNALSGSIGGTGTQNDILDNIFDTSVLDAAVDINLVLQALNQKTNVRILQEPRVFTADNMEAVFFDGQDIPFLSNSNTTDQGGLTQGFDYKAVGVMLNVRPRITAQNGVDMEINLELSKVVPGQTLFGGAIVDRRQTTTQVVIENRQTIVLSGILQDSETQLIRKVPLLGDIPLLGELFTSRENAKSTSELLVFITPVVVENPSASDELNAEDIEQLRLFNDTNLGKDGRKILGESIQKNLKRRMTPAAPIREEASNTSGAVPVDIDDVNGEWDN
jgi:general secretion pathway protein D